MFVRVQDFHCVYMWFDHHIAYDCFFCLLYFVWILLGSKLLTRSPGGHILALGIEVAPHSFTGDRTDLKNHMSFLQHNVLTRFLASTKTQPVE